MRLLTTKYKSKDVLSKREALMDALYNSIPVGVGREGLTKLSKEELCKVLMEGAKWALSKGYCTKDDLLRTEEEGCIEGADVKAVSDRAIKRGLKQLGTLGSGNHFLEIQKVDKIYDKKVAKAFGITGEDQVVLMVHSGSRGLGHQVASDYIRKMEEEYGYEHLPDRELACAPVKSKLGEDYYKAMCCAINFAFCNRQMMAHRIREAFAKEMGCLPEDIKQIYDVCHNLAKYEEHMVDGKKKMLCVHRKGATRSFGPGREEVPDCYKEVGQPVLIPGSMGTASFLLVGTEEAEELSFGSTVHGAGRVMSRHAAINSTTGEQVKKKLQAKDIHIKERSMKGLAEEAPEAYKDVDEVVRVSDGAGLGKLVARLIPLAVMKG